MATQGQIVERRVLAKMWRQWSDIVCLLPGNNGPAIAWTAKLTMSFTPSCWPRSVSTSRPPSQARKRCSAAWKSCSFPG